jgi:hypothetical protein
MRTLIYKLFLAVGIFASTMGIANSADASVPLVSTELTPSLKSQNTSDKLYFSDVIKNSGNEELHAAHYSHSSHSSHVSHHSHYSGR